jgi:hypothetical protein
MVLGFEHTVLHSRNAVEVHDGVRVEARAMCDVISVVLEFMLSVVRVEARAMCDFISVVLEFMLSVVRVEAPAMRGFQLVCLSGGHSLISSHGK